MKLPKILIRSLPVKNTQNFGGCTSKPLISRKIKYFRTFSRFFLKKQIGDIPTETLEVKMVLFYLLQQNISIELHINFLCCWMKPTQPSDLIFVTSILLMAAIVIT